MRELLPKLFDLGFWQGEQNVLNGSLQISLPEPWMAVVGLSWAASPLLLLHCSVGGALLPQLEQNQAP